MEARNIPSALLPPRAPASRRERRAAEADQRRAEKKARRNGVSLTGEEVPKPVHPLAAISTRNAYLAAILSRLVETLGTPDPETGTPSVRIDVETLASTADLSIIADADGRTLIVRTKPSSSAVEASPEPAPSEDDSEPEFPTEEPVTSPSRPAITPDNRGA